MAWGKAGSTTLTTTGDTITVSDTTSSYFNQTLSHVIQTTGNIRMATRVGNGSIDTGSNYANRSSENGGADGTATSQTYHKNSGSVASDMFTINYAVNIATEEKLFISNNVVRSTSGAGTAPQRMESVGKWANTSNQFDYIETVNDQGGDYTTDSNLTALGSDLTPAAAVPAIENVQDNSLFVEKENARRYWFSGSTWTMQPTFEENTFSSGWTSTDSTNVNTNTTTKVIDANVPSTGAQTGVLTYPLGYTLENNFVLEFKMEITSYTDNTDNTHQEIYIGMTNNTSAYNVSQQFIGMSISNAGSGGGNDRYALQEFYNEALTANNGQGDSTNRPNANDIRYHRISKSGSTLTYSIYSDSSYSTLVETISGTATDTYSLNTISVKLRALDGTQNGVLTVEIDDIKIYNGVGTIN